ncbi:ParA family protein [Candidatus Oscillochloris fontis]|uniref:ParA family protein n=1 Tax=Candidatus Oscillochloris fontis TaxID=2496868 RepID=UPI00101D0D51|nr:ParA family protein [Candidatus Oscillochloris fontis]
MGRVIAVTNLKGGIGKTTTVVNLSAGFALRGSRVLLVDTDAQGNLSMALGVQPRRTLYDVLVDGAKLSDCISPARPNLDLIAADASLLTAQPEISRRPDWARVLDKALMPLRSHYDVILIDSGGSLTVLNVNAINAATDILVPTTVEPFALKGLEVLIQQLKRIKGNTAALRAIVPTLYDTRTRQSVELLDTLRERYGDLVLDPIRVNVRLSECTAQGKTIYEFDPRSRGALDYARLVEQMSARIQLGPATPPLAPSTPTPPMVTGAGAVLNATCPNCGRPLQRANVAGYRILYCDHCKYRRQELAAGDRR